MPKNDYWKTAKTWIDLNWERWNIEMARSKPETDDYERELLDLARKYEDGRVSIALHERQADAIRSLHLLIDHYHQTNGIYLIAASQMVGALTTWHRGTQSAPTMLRRPSEAGQGGHQFTTEQHDWIKGHAVAVACFSAGLGQKSQKEAAEKVAKWLSAAQYVPARGSANITGQAVMKWMQAELTPTNNDTWSAANHALVDIVLSLGKPPHDPWSLTEQELELYLKDIIRFCRMDARLRP